MTKRPGLYIMVFLILLDSCAGNVTRVEQKLDALIEQVEALQE